MDRHIPKVMDLWADYLPFVPRWRRDDIMISYSASGGGIGAHGASTALLPSPRRITYTCLPFFLSQWIITMSSCFKEGVALLLVVCPSLTDYSTYVQRPAGMGDREQLPQRSRGEEPSSHVLRRKRAARLLGRSEVDDEYWRHAVLASAHTSSR